MNLAVFRERAKTRREFSALRFRRSSMQLKICSRNDRSASTWAGGATTQLWIWPQDGDYASRNFSARISSATVNLPESDFTALPGVVRYITPLDGNFTLSHPDGRAIAMRPLDPPYRFDGGVPTHCSGTATDFNLMLKDVDGSMSVLRGDLTVDGGFCCLYPVDGAGVEVNGKALDLSLGDLVVIRTERGEKVVVRSPQAIVCQVSI